MSMTPSAVWPKRQYRAGHSEIEEHRLPAPAHENQHHEIAEQYREEGETDRLIRPARETIDFGDRIGIGNEADGEHEAHSQPKGDARDHGEARNFSGGEAGRAVEPEAHRPSGDEREAQRERDRIARERGERRQPVGNLGADMAQREPVIARQREIADRDEPERHRDLIPARGGEGRLEFAGVNPDQRATEDEGRNRDDQDAERHPESVQQNAVRSKNDGPAVDSARQFLLLGQAWIGQASFFQFRHAPAGSSVRGWPIEPMVASGKPAEGR